MLLTARQPRHRRGVVGLALDERERLQDRVVQVRGEALAHLLVGVLGLLAVDARQRRDQQRRADDDARPRRDEHEQQHLREAAVADVGAGDADRQDGRPADQQHAGDGAPGEHRPRRGGGRQMLPRRVAPAGEAEPHAQRVGDEHEAADRRERHEQQRQQPGLARLHSALRPGSSEAWPKPNPVRLSASQPSGEQRERGHEQQRRLAVHGRDGLRREHEPGDHDAGDADREREHRRELPPSAIASPASCAVPATAVAFHSGSARRGPRATVTGAALTGGPSPGARTDRAAAARCGAATAPARDGARASCAIRRRAAAFGVPGHVGPGLGEDRVAGPVGHRRGVDAVGIVAHEEASARGLEVDLQRRRVAAGVLVAGDAGAADLRIAEEDDLRERTAGGARDDRRDAGRERDHVVLDVDVHAAVVGQCHDRAPHAGLDPQRPVVRRDRGVAQVDEHRAEAAAIALARRVAQRARGDGHGSIPRLDPHAAGRERHRRQHEGGDRQQRPAGPDARRATRCPAAASRRSSGAIAWAMRRRTARASQPRAHRQSRSGPGRVREVVMSQRCPRDLGHPPPASQRSTGWCESPCVFAANGGGRRHGRSSGRSEFPRGRAT